MPATLPLRLSIVGLLSLSLAPAAPAPAPVAHDEAVQLPSVVVQGTQPKVRVYTGPLWKEEMLRDGTVWTIDHETFRQTFLFGERDIVRAVSTGRGTLTDGMISAPVDLQRLRWHIEDEWLVFTEGNVRIEELKLINDGWLYITAARRDGQKLRFRATAPRKPTAGARPNTITPPALPAALPARSGPDLPRSRTVRTTAPATPGSQIVGSFSFDDGLWWRTLRINHDRSFSFYQLSKSSPAQPPTGVPSEESWGVSGSWTLQRPDELELVSPLGTSRLRLRVRLPSNGQAEIQGLENLPAQLRQWEAAAAPG